MFNITVIATDQGIEPQSSSAVVSVHILDENEAPVFTASYKTFTVDENIAFGQVIGRVEASDGDEGS